MQLTIFNGSPKKGPNNTGALAQKFAEGFAGKDGNEYSAYKLNGFKNLDEAVRIYNASEYVIIAFPLYNYSMPAVVKEFIERLEPLVREGNGKRIGFMVQFGFPEAIHARALERYLERLAGLLNCEYLGTVLKGGCNDLAKKPEKHKKILTGIREIGGDFGKTGRLNKESLKRFSRPETLGFIPKVILRLIAVCINTFYWDVELKKNGAFKNRFAGPYQGIGG